MTTGSVTKCIILCAGEVDVNLNNLEATAFSVDRSEIRGYPALKVIHLWRESIPTIRMFVVREPLDTVLEDIKNYIFFEDYLLELGVRNKSIEQEISQRLNKAFSEYWDLSETNFNTHDFVANENKCRRCKLLKRYMADHNCESQQE